MHQPWIEPLLEHLTKLGSLRAVCKLEGMPSRSTVCRLLREDGGFAEAYALAKAIGIDNFVDETLEIADAEMSSFDVPRAKLRVETRRWLAERMLPKVYGPKAALEMSGEMAVTLDATARRARIASILAAAEARSTASDIA